MNTPKLEVLDSLLARMEASATRVRSKSAPRAAIPFDCDGEISLENFVLDQWVDFPLPGLSGKLVGSDAKNLYVLVEAAQSVDLGRHRHLGWSEEVIMIEGAMRDNFSGEVYLPGENYYHAMAGQEHWPHFIQPSKCMVIWRG